MYRPSAKDYIRHWITRITRTCQNSPRLILAIPISIFLLTLLYWGGMSGRNVDVYGPVVLVVVLDQTAGDQGGIIDKVLENRADYALAHGTSYS